MKSKRSGYMKGVYAAVVMPLQKDRRVDVACLVEHCNHLITKGCAGVVLFGTTGEGASFSLEEKIRVLKQIVAMGLNPNHILVGVICSALEDALALTKAAIQYNTLGVLVAPSFYYKKLPEQGIVNFFKDVASILCKKKQKMILYHIPQYTGVPITLSMIETLLKEFPETIVALKESEGNIEYAKEVLHTFPTLSLFAGSEKNLVESVRLGGAGAICGLPNLYPELVLSLYECGQNSHRPDHTQKIVTLIRVLKQYTVIAAFKFMLHQKRSSFSLDVCPPLVSLSKEEGENLYREIASLDLNY